MGKNTTKGRSRQQRKHFQPKPEVKGQGHCTELQAEREKDQKPEGKQAKDRQRHFTETDITAALSK